MDGSATEAPPVAQATEEGQIDLRQLISVFRRHLRLFAAVVLLVFIPVILFTLQATPRYTATAAVMLDVRKENVVDVNAVLSGLPPDSAVVDTEVEVLKSRSMAEKVVDRLKLDQDPEFNSALRPPGLMTRLRAYVAPSAPRAAVGGQRRREQVIDSVRRHLTVNRSGLTFLINISFESTSPVKAAQISNAFAQMYLFDQLDAKFDATRQANTWLNERLGELRGQVQEAEAAVQQYRIANNLMSAQGATLTEQEISTLNSQLAATRASQAEQEARLNIARAQLAAGSTGDDVGEALSSPVVQRLRDQRSQQSAKVADLSARYGDRHPDLLNARRALADIDDQIQQEIRRIISNLEAQAQVARERTASIENSAARSRNVLVGNNRAAVRLQELERNADAVRTLYESFLNRFKQTSAQEGIEQSDARVVSQASIPGSASYPNKGLNLLIGMAAGVLAGLMAIALAELLNRGLFTVEDVEQKLGVPSIGSIPVLASTLDGVRGRLRHLSPVDDVVERPLSGFAEAFRNLRASILFSRIGERVQVVAITSSLPGEGKTTTSICLARTLAITGGKVVVVDCDLRQRAINTILDSEPRLGLLELLNGKATLEEVLVRDEESGAMILPLAKSAYTPKDVFGTAPMRRLLDDLRTKFDVIVLDTAPVLPLADTRVLAPLADVVVVLARWKKTQRKAVEATLRLLGGSNAYVAGVALTQVDLRAQTKYGYGDPGYYYKAYRKYYGQ